MDESPFSWVEEYNDPFCPPPTASKRKAKSKKLEFVGWGSKPLIEFLDSIGKDTSQLISRHDATAIITRYVNENNLVHPLKKKRINCDERLHALFGRKSIARNKIHSLLDSHYADDNLENSDDELLFSSEDEIGTANSEQHKTERKTPPKKRALETNRSSFAAIIPDNVKLVYLRKSSVKDLLNDTETFERKIVGSYVRIKSDPYDYLQKNSHCLLQVQGIKKVPGADGTSKEILFHVSNFLKDIPISFLSDENFSEEECEDLRQRIKDGLLKKPTVVELEEKAQILHEDLTKHWIVRELALLQKLIDRANEKGWRRELLEYLDKRELLQSPAEQSRLLREVPKVLADVIEQEAPLHDNPDGIKQGNNGSQVPILKETSEIPIRDLVGYDTSCFVSRNTEFTGIQAALPKSKQQIEQGIQAAMPMPKQQTLLGIQADLPMSEIEADLPISKQSKEPEIQADLPISKRRAGSEIQADFSNSKRQIEAENLLEFPVEKNEITNESSNIAAQPMRNEENKVPMRNEENKVLEVIDLSDDEEDDKNEYPGDIDVESYEWYYIDPQGDIQGPFAIASLKRWSDADYFPPSFKVWKIGQSQDEAVLLSDLLEWAYPNY